MTSVFADASYWIAIFKKNDKWNNAAVTARRRLDETTLVTTDEVLTEFLSAMSKSGDVIRREAAGVVRDILDDPGVRVVHQTHESFLDGLGRYESRLDKEYSLQDCTSMNVMDAKGITEILTSDHHFEQEGFTILMDSTS